MLEKPSRVKSVLEKPRRVRDWKALGAVRARDGRCLVCGAPPMKWPHHVVPRSVGGSDVPENLIMLCLSCHRRAHDGGLSRVELQRVLSEKYGYKEVRDGSSLF